MAVRWYSVVVDCRDPRAQAEWWAQALGWRLAFESDDEIAVLPPHAFADGYFDRVPAPERAPGLVFVPVGRRKTVRNRLHLDLAPEAGDDHETEVQRLLTLGASRVAAVEHEGDWVTLADPEGNEFCVLPPRDV